MKVWSQKKGPWRMVGIVLVAIVFAVVIVMPAPAGLTAPQKHMAVVAILMAILWISEIIPIAVTALLPLVLFPVFGILSTKDTAPHYAQQIYFLFLGGYMIAAAMQKCNLHRRLALKTVIWIGFDLRRLVLGFMVACAFLSMWISNTATVMMLLPIAATVADQVFTGQQVEDHLKRRFGEVLMLGLAYAASIGGVATLVGTPPNVIFVGLIDKLYPEAPEVSFFQWMRLGLPVTAIFLPLVWLYLTRVGLPKELLVQASNAKRGRDYLENQLRQMGNMQYAEKWVLTILAGTSFLWIFRRDIPFGSLFTIPGWAGLLPFGSFVSDATVAIAMGSLLFFIPNKNNADTLDAKRDFLLTWQTFQSRVPWDICVLIGGGFALAAGMQASELTLWMADKLSFFSGLPPFLLILSICLIMTFVTEVTSNTATATMALPVLAALATAIDLHPYVLMLPALFSVSCAFMLPVATPPNAFVFGSGFVTMRTMAKTGFALNLLGALLISVLCYFFSGSLFGFDPSQIPPWLTTAP